MRIVEGYIARQIARTSGIVLLIMTVAFVLERSLRLMHEVDPSALPPALAAGLLAARVPEILGIALPWSFFAGMLLTFQRLVRDSELDAAYAAGLGPRDIARPLLLATVIAAVLLALVYWFLLPHGHYQVRQLTQRAAQAAIGAPLKPGSFVQLADGVLYIEPRTSGGLANIFVYQPGVNGDRYVTTAVVEDFELSKQKGTLFFAARDGRRVTIPGEGRSSGLLTFKHVRQLVYAVSPAAMAPRGRDTGELTLPELLAPPEALAREQPDHLGSQLHIKFARVLAVFLLPLMAVPLALGFPASRQWIAMVLGGLLMLGLDQALIYGEALASRGAISPWAGIWGSMAVFAAIAALLSSLQGLRFSRSHAGGYP
jgi:lipopolysaccharide export system permease protein